MPFECFAGLQELDFRVQNGDDNITLARELLEAVNTVVEGTNRLQRRRQWTGNLSNEDMLDYERRWFSHGCTNDRWSRESRNDCINMLRIWCNTNLTQNRNCLLAPIIRGGAQYYITPRYRRGSKTDISYPETSHFTIGRSHFEMIIPTSNDGGYRLAKYTGQGGQVWVAQPPCIQLSVNNGRSLLTSGLRIPWTIRSKGHRRRYPYKNVLLCSSTGVSSSRPRGTSFHSDLKKAFIVNMEEHLIYIYHAYFPASYLTSMYREARPTGSINLKRLPSKGFNTNTPLQRSQFWDSLACIFSYLVSGEAKVGYLQQSLEIPTVSPAPSH
jgi:hypothetical protein